MAKTVAANMIIEDMDGENKRRSVDFQQELPLPPYTGLYPESADAIAPKSANVEMEARDGLACVKINYAFETTESSASAVFLFAKMEDMVI